MNQFQFFVGCASTIGAWDSITSSLQIILGKMLLLDIAQVVSWREVPSHVGRHPVYATWILL